MAQSDQEQLSELTKIVSGLDHRLIRVEQDVAVIKSNYATKADVLEAGHSITMWLVSAVLFAQVIPVLLKMWAG